MDENQFAEKFRAVLVRRRERLGLTQAQVAERMDVCKRTVHRFEAGDRRVRYLVELLRIADALDISLERLLYEARHFDET